MRPYCSLLFDQTRVTSINYQPTSRTRSSNSVTPSISTTSSFSRNVESSAITQTTLASNRRVLLSDVDSASSSSSSSSSSNSNSNPISTTNSGTTTSSTTSTTPVQSGRDDIFIDKQLQVLKEQFQDNTSLVHFSSAYNSQCLQNGNTTLFLSQQTDCISEDKAKIFVFPFQHGYHWYMIMALITKDQGQPPHLHSKHL